LPDFTTATTVSGTGQVGYNIILYANGLQIGTQNNLTTTV
jgi:hypothetical protein